MPEITCSAPDCERGGPLRRGMCNKHYWRWWKANRPNTNRSRPPEERFWEKVDRRSEDECWPWTAATTGIGHGRFWTGVETYAVPAHRFAYELLIGRIPDGLTLDHLCRNPACVNPRHLEPVTREENSRREAEARFGDGCARGHAWTDENTHIEANGARKCRTCRRARERR